MWGADDHEERHDDREGRHDDHNDDHNDDHGEARSIVMATSSVSPTAISWNRNNKVAAVGFENGSVQIRYANGTCMSTLQDDYLDEGEALPVSSVSWSTGSKTLAVGTVGGRVSVHDMTTKQHVSKAIRHDSAVGGGYRGTLKAVGLQHHPDDAFLAVGGRESVELYSLRLEEAKGSCVCSASSVVKSDASFSSVSVATGKPYLAAGSDKNGIVAVWDYITETELACDKFRHAHKGSTKVALAPLTPYLLYSVGMDGILKMQDLRLPSSIASPTAMASVPSASGITSVSVHEYSGDIALGTSDGYVHIFSEGLTLRQPKRSLFFGDTLRGEECPVLAVDWTRSYHNVTLHARQVVLDSEQAVAPRSTLGQRFAQEEERLALRTKLNESSAKKETPVTGTARAATVSTSSPSRPPSSHTSQPSETEGESLVRRASTADPWQIRAATAVDSDANTPSRRARPTPAPGRVEEAKEPIASMTKAPVHVAQATAETAAVDGTDVQSRESGADLSQLILALHLDMVQMYEAQSAEIRGLREEVQELKQALHDASRGRNPTADWLL